MILVLGPNTKDEIGPLCKLPKSAADRIEKLFCIGRVLFKAELEGT